MYACILYFAIAVNYKHFYRNVNNSNFVNFKFHTICSATTVYGISFSLWMSTAIELAGRFKLLEKNILGTPEIITEFI